MAYSPFFVVENFISPLQCEKIISALAIKTPSIDERGDPIKYERLVPTEFAQPIATAFNDISVEVGARYDGAVSVCSLKFQQYWENLKRPAEELSSGAWTYSRKKWSKVKDIDLIGFIWLKDYNSSAPIDPRFETYGAKVEFPAYNFSLTPIRGTLVLFPASPHFVFAISHVLFGSMEQVVVTSKITVDGKAWEYNSSKFPGTYREWFLENT